MAEKQEFRHFVRVANTDLLGSKPIIRALTKIQGIGPSISSIICVQSNIQKSKKAGVLEQNEIEALEKSIREMDTPVWIKNRPKDPETGEDRHIMTTDLVFTKDNDIKLMKKIKSYKGLRHAWRLPVRGQRTKSNFRKGTSMGVVKKKVVMGGKK